MSPKQAKIFLIQAETILDESRKLKGLGPTILHKEGGVYYYFYLTQIDELIENYNLLAPKVNKILQIEGVSEEIKLISKIEPNNDNIKDDNRVYNSDKKLLQLIFGSSTILSFLQEGIVLPEVARDKLDYIKKELDELKEDLEEGFYVNLNEAKIEFEAGCFLGSSLISGKVINWSLDQIPGDINQKIVTLKNGDLIREKDGKDFILKANHFARNIVSHDLTITITSSQAISYLGDAISVAKIVSSYLLAKRKERSVDKIS